MAKRVVPAKEREYLDGLVRGVYVKRDLPAGHVLTDEDVFLAVPLLKGQISTREFESGEVLKTPLATDEPVLLGDIDAHYVSDPEVLRLVPDRGMAWRLPDMKVVVNQCCG
jgi:N-acetylneuraminate synthase